MFSCLFPNSLYVHNLLHFLVKPVSVLSVMISFWTALSRSSCHSDPLLSWLYCSVTPHLASGHWVLTLLLSKTRFSPLRIRGEHPGIGVCCVLCVFGNFRLQLSVSEDCRGATWHGQCPRFLFFSTCQVNLSEQESLCIKVSLSYTNIGSRLWKPVTFVGWHRRETIMNGIWKKSVIKFSSSQVFLNIA